ncbi:protein OXIDATIVE STRESS 3 LIKE 1-like [Prosopis cineraria]|uniref:protein OXIDATIVE STRESS 3 LIKE 1-like n=1 Tax=Prosopis cineraria TaxID=364024 RepID=UPI00240FD6AF|nr:protein OXIDATIVE STRESS 3 LIKE 1-like [Prosopis cineraria]
MRVKSSQLTRAVTCTSAFFDPSQDRKPEAGSGGDRALPAKVADDKFSTSSSSTSSIGRNSDLSSERSMGDEDRGENEAQSAYNGSLDMMQSLEEVLPVSRGISKFYNGKSKSFTNLTHACSSPSVKDLAKPDNGYNRKRRNLMAFNHVWNKNRSFPLKSNSGGISKRTILSSSRSALALAVAMNSSDSSSSITSEDSISKSPPYLPPLHPLSSASSITSGGSPSPFAHNFSTWRSFSLADLQHCATTATMKMPSSSSLRSETALSKLT